MLAHWPASITDTVASDSFGVRLVRSGWSTLAERILRVGTSAVDRTIGSNFGGDRSLLFGYALGRGRPAQSRLPAAHP